MKRKELKNLAEKIAKYELMIQDAETAEIKEKAEQEIINITKRLKSLEDLIEIEELVQEILSKN